MRSLSSIAGQRRRTRPGQDVYDQFQWEERHVLWNSFRDGSVTFEQRGVQVPTAWSVNASDILASKYLRCLSSRQDGSDVIEWVEQGKTVKGVKEHSLRQALDRIVNTITQAGIDGGYFDVGTAEVFNQELKYLMLDQRASFNTPVWFNIGVPGASQQSSACFILHVDDNMPSIRRWFEDETTVFLGGSGAGLNVSNIRSTHERLSSGLKATGPLSFMAVADTNAGTLKCLAAGTPVTTAKGPQPIESLAVGTLVQTRSGLRPVQTVYSNGIKSLVRVDAEAGMSVRCTPEHKFWVRGKDDTEGWREAGHLRPGDYLAVDLSEPGRGPAKQPGGSRLAWTRATVTPDGTGPTYDLHIVDAHEYQVSGLVVHNSGSGQRKAAKMVIMDADHPDIMDFIWCKALEERKAAALSAAGFDMDLDSRDMKSIQYQNANNSVRLTDEFMRKALGDGKWQLRARTTGEVTEEMDAADILDAIARAAWECADPGVQFTDTINRWHTLADEAPIYGSNPCSEYMSLDNTSCNLASVNVLRYLQPDNTFALDEYVADCQLLALAMEILVSFADYPTEEIKKNSRRYRQLGQGLCNLGALLMSMGLPYDSDASRNVAAGLQAVQTGAVYLTSAQIAELLGPYEGYAETAGSMQRVLEMHRDAAVALGAAVPRDQPVASALGQRARELWDRTIDLSKAHGVRSAQATVAAPTGTISFVMGADTTGIEPDFSLIKSKKLVGGGHLKIVNQSVLRALHALGYNEQTAADIAAFVGREGRVQGAPGLDPDHYPVFACAMGEDAIEPMGHIRMVAAIQPFLSGAASKTVNLPSTATVQDIKDVYVQAWHQGVKAVSLYRDGSKQGQPLAAVTTAKDKPEIKEPERAQPDDGGPPKAVRRKLPRKRKAEITRFSVADAEGYMEVGMYPSGQPGELFLKVSKQGSALNTIMDALAIGVSVGLQYGVPLEVYVAKYSGMKAEPAGATDDPELRFASSILDYVFRRMALDFMDPEARQALNILSTTERAANLDAQEQAPAVSTLAGHAAAHTSRASSDAPYCMACGSQMTRAGTCFACAACGTTTGCS